MATGPNPSILLAQAVGLAARAAGMAHASSDQGMRDQLALIETVARAARASLNGPLPPAPALIEMQATLKTQGKRLDEIEDQLRANAGAKP